MTNIPSRQRTERIQKESLKKQWASTPEASIPFERTEGTCLLVRREQIV